MKHYTRFSYGRMNLEKEEIICLEDIITVSKSEQTVFISFKDKKHDDIYEFPSTFEATTVFNKIWEMLIKEWK